jgi:maltose O-acetyltransferase
MIYRMVNFLARAWNKAVASPIKKSAFGKCGKNVTVGRKAKFLGINNLIVGNRVMIGEECLFMSTLAKIRIGDNVMIGPRVTCITGGHRTDIIGRYMISITNEEKRPEDDRDIVFEGDIWSTKVQTNDELDRALKVTQIMNKLCYIEICTDKMDVPELSKLVIEDFKKKNKEETKLAPKQSVLSNTPIEIKKTENSSFQTTVHTSLKNIGE